MTENNMHQESGSRRIVKQWRLDNLNAILSNIKGAEHIEAARKVLTEAIVKAVPNKKNNLVNHQLGRFISVGGDKKEPLLIGDQWAENIEDGVRHLVNEGRLDKYWATKNILDYPPRDPVVVYVLASIRIAAWGEILSVVESIDGFCEASLVYGDSDMDALIKIQAPIEQIHNAILRISSHSHVTHTQTLQAMPYSRMQRQQKEENPDLGNLSVLQMYNKVLASGNDMVAYQNPINKLENYIFPSNRFRKVFLDEANRKLTDASEISDMRLTFKRETDLLRLPEIIVDAARHSIQAVVIWEDVGSEENEHRRNRLYLKAQAGKIKRAGGQFSVKRVFVVNDFENWPSIHGLKERIGCEIIAGIEVRLIEKRYVPRQKDDDKIQDYGIFDNTGRWIVETQRNIEGIRIVKFSLNVEDIKDYSDRFNAIWLVAREIDESSRNECKDAVKNISCW